MSWFRRLLARKASNAVDEAVGEFPPAWMEILRQRVPHDTVIPPAQRARWRQLIRTFVAEKEFWGSAQLPVTEEMKVIVAAQACILILNLPRLGVYPQTKEVVIRPDEFGEIVEAIGPDGRTYQIDLRREGEAVRRGPILLAWDAVKSSALDRLDGCNTVFHEFAHALDFLNGEADGVPPLESPEQLEPWKKVLAAELNDLRSAASRGRRTLLDPYGAENPAEFFAVATEHFFEEGRRMRRNLPRLYGQLKTFYQQDPAAWG